MARSLNLHRRHMTESQRAMVAAKLANLDHGGIRDGQNTEASQAANLQFEPVTRSAAAAMLNVSERSVNTAKAVQASAPPEVVQAVEQGSISVSLAAKVAELPEAAQVVSHWPFTV